MHRVTRLAWTRLNADGLLVAALAFVSSLDLLHPDASDLAQAAGYIPPSFYIWTVSYLLAGLALMAGFLGSPSTRMPLELTGRLLLCIGYTLQTLRSGSILGWFSEDMLIFYLLWTVLVTVCALRVSLLLAPKGTVVVIGRHRR
jgi:hypothetical protein